MLFPSAKIVFATSTAVIEEKCSADFRRHNANIEKFNQTAINALADTDAIINDMYAFTANCPEECHSDAVHFNNDKGIALTGGKVLAVICKELKISPSDVNIDDFEPENYSESNIGY